MQEELGEDIKVSIQDVTKNNGVVFTGLTFTQKNVNISPTVYGRYHQRNSGDLREK